MHSAHLFEIIFFSFCYLDSRRCQISLARQKQTLTVMTLPLSSKELKLPFDFIAISPALPMITSFLIKEI